MRWLKALALLVPGLALFACGDGDPASAAEEGPMVIAMSPAPGHSFVASDQAFAVEFTAAMDEPSVEAAYSVIGPSGAMGGRFDWSDDSTVMTFTPEGLSDGMEVEVRWGKGMRGQSGHGLRDADGSSMDSFSFGAMAFDIPDSFGSNGERIYFTATSASGQPISYDMADDDEASMTGYGSFQAGMGRMGGMGGGMTDSDQMHNTDGAMRGMTCASCHGPDGAGGIYLAMGTIKTPSIQSAELTAAEDVDDEHAGDDEEAHGHEPYTTDTLIRAIAEGLDPAGEELAWPMPRWKMAEQDMTDLVEYVESL